MSTENIFNRISSEVGNYYTNNKKNTNIIGGTLLLLGGLIAFWTLYWHPKRENDAALKLAKLHHYFDSDSFNIVVNGIKGKKIATAPNIADSYGFTKKGKEAALMAGLSFMHTGKFEKAIKYLDKSDANDLLLAPAIISAKAACYAELGKPDKAAKQYEKAAELGNNDYTSQFLKKAGIQYELAKDYKSAIRCWEKLRQSFGKSPEASDIEKYIYRAKGLLGELNN